MEVYHVLSRGVDKRTIFEDKKDYFRFIHNLYEFNDENRASNNSYLFGKTKSIDLASRYKERRKRKLLVDIYGFCLMKNHFHLILVPLVEEGVPKFMRKLNMGYAKYFNIKYDRKGALFEGRYKSVLIENDAHFSHLLCYIHLNPLDGPFPEWRDRKVKNVKEALEYLGTYRWSSHLDYLGKGNFASVTSRDHYLETFNSVDGYERALIQWMHAPRVGRIESIILE